jgi:hypothetical protein
MHPPFSVVESVAIESSSHRSDSLSFQISADEDRDFNTDHPIKSRVSYASKTAIEATFHLRHHHHPPSTPTMPKRKLPSSSSPPQPSLKQFLPILKPLPHPVSKRAKLVSQPPSPQKEEAGPPCPNSPSTDDLVQLFEYIDEVLLFSGKPLLWGHIQEEVFSLHKRYSPPIHGC